MQLCAPWLSQTFKKYNSNFISLLKVRKLLVCLCLKYLTICFLWNVPLIPVVQIRLNNVFTDVAQVYRLCIILYYFYTQHSPSYVHNTKDVYIIIGRCRVGSRSWFGSGAEVAEKDWCWVGLVPSWLVTKTMTDSDCSITIRYRLLGGFSYKGVYLVTHWGFF